MASVCPKTSVCASVRRSWGEQRGGITPRCPMSPRPWCCLPLALPTPLPEGMAQHDSPVRRRPRDAAGISKWTFMSCCRAFRAVGRALPSYNAQLGSSRHKDDMPGLHQPLGTKRSCPTCLLSTHLYHCPRRDSSSSRVSHAGLWMVFCSSPFIFNPSFFRLRGVICQYGF